MDDISAALTTAKAYGGKIHRGAIHSSVAGRTDHLPMHVSSGSYVIPADIISAMGEGNSMAGFKVAKSIFSAKGPYGSSGLPYGASGLPYGAEAPHKAEGGPIDLGEAREKKKLQGFHSGLMGDIRSRGKEMAEALQKHRDAGTFDGYEPGTRLLGKTGNGPAPFKIEGHTVADWDKNSLAQKAFAARGVTPSLIEHGGRRWLPMLNTSTGKPDSDDGDWSRSQAYLDLVKHAKYPVMGGPKKAAGGATQAVPIVAAGGEYVVPPEDVAHIGNGSLDDGHKILDAFVKKMRQKTIKTLQNLPGPRKD
jgi:hypothetical protein